MTDAAFRKGMKQMAAVFPDRDEDETVKATRGQVYRKVLDYMSDEEWLYAVDEALKYERWFPTPATLISFADEYQPPPKFLPEGRRTPEVIEERRVGHVEGVTQLRAELVRLGLLPADAQAPVSSMPRGDR